MPLMISQIHLLCFFIDKSFAFKNNFCNIRNLKQQTNLTTLTSMTRHLALLCALFFLCQITASSQEIKLQLEWQEANDSFIDRAGNVVWRKSGSNAIDEIPRVIQMLSNNKASAVAIN
jgi:hypothetical protein